MKAAILARVSTTREDQEHGPESQIRACRELLKAKGVDAGDAVVYEEQVVKIVTNSSCLARSSGESMTAREIRGAVMRVALYARNSKAPRGWKPSSPGEEPPGSWRTQLARLREWAAREGHEVALEEHDVASGGNPHRPAWSRALAEARGHHVHAIAATKLDRVMRSAGHFHQVAEELTALGVDLIFVDSGMRISGRDPFNKAVLGILAVIAELERDLARERSMGELHVGEDGRLYGPRSDRPSGRPKAYGSGHKFRVREGREIHDRARCPACGGRGAAPPKGAEGAAGGGSRPRAQAGGSATAGGAVQPAPEDHAVPREGAPS